MKIAMLILGVIGSLIALAGSLMTMIGGFGTTAVGSLAENASTATSGAFVFWSGVVAVLVSALALVFSVTGGVAKRKNVIFAFSLGTLLAGGLSIYLYNWFSGGIIGVSGILGLAGAKDGIADDKKSPMLYVVLVIMAILAAASALIKNGGLVVQSEMKETAAALPQTTAPASVPAPSAKPADSTPPGLPFVGKRLFNFAGGSGTGRSISIRADGFTRVESYGTAGSTVDYEGPFSNPIREATGAGLLFRDGRLYLTMDGEIEKDCKGDGKDCVSDLYPE